jgi:hypothetical protein
MEQGIGLRLQALVHLLTTLLPCVKVYVESAPGVLCAGTFLHQAIFCTRGLPAFPFV